MDHLSEFQRQLCTAVSTVGPRLTRVCLGAADEYQLIQWITVDQLSATLRARVRTLSEIITQATSSARADDFLSTHDEELKTTPALYLLTMPADEVEQTRAMLLARLGSFRAQRDITSMTAAA